MDCGDRGRHIARRSLPHERVEERVNELCGWMEGFANSVAPSQAPSFHATHVARGRTAALAKRTGRLLPGLNSPSTKFNARNGGAPLSATTRKGKSSAGAPPGSPTAEVCLRLQRSATTGIAAKRGVDPSQSCRTHSSGHTLSRACAGASRTPCECTNPIDTAAKGQPALTHRRRTQRGRQDDRRHSKALAVGLLHV